MPEYESRPVEFELDLSGVALMCFDCGAIVGDRGHHDHWHEGQAKTAKAASRGESAMSLLMPIGSTSVSASRDDGSAFPTREDGIPGPATETADQVGLAPSEPSSVDATGDECIECRQPIKSWQPFQVANVLRRHVPPCPLAAVEIDMPGANSVWCGNYESHAPHAFTGSSWCQGNQPSAPTDVPVELDIEPKDREGRLWKEHIAAANIPLGGDAAPALEHRRTCDVCFLLDLLDKARSVDRAPTEAGHVDVLIEELRRITSPQFAAAYPRYEQRFGIAQDAVKLSLERYAERAADVTGTSDVEGGRPAHVDGKSPSASDYPGRDYECAVCGEGPTVPVTRLCDAHREDFVRWAHARSAGSAEHNFWRETAQKGWHNYHYLAAAYDAPEHARGPIEGCKAATCKFFMDVWRQSVRASTSQERAE